MKARKLMAAPLLVGAFALAACGGGNSGGQSSGNQSVSKQQASAIEDINAQPRDKVADGGELRLAISDFGTNWNPDQVDGNLAELTTVRNSLLPTNFDFDSGGNFTPDPNYLLSANATTGSPTVVTLKLNPKAVWGDGDPIDVDDYIATWKANNGTNTKFQSASTDGFSSVASIKAGADKFEVIITYKGVFPDWSQPWSSPNPLKAESVKDPETFNSGWANLKNDWLSGPFKMDNFDKTQKVLTLVPNDKWWGDKPKLSKVTWRAVDEDAQAAAFQNNELDTFEVGLNPDAYQRSKGVAGATVRKANGPDFRQFTFNSKAGNMKDKAVRQAVVQALNRSQIAASDLAGINDWKVTPLDNHFLLPGQDGYTDNAAATNMAFSVDAAKKTLDDDGWKAASDGAVRMKDGKPLVVNISQLTGIAASENEAALAQKMLTAVGMKVNLVGVPVAKFGTTLSGHAFEIISFSWIGTPYPFANMNQIYGTGSESNYAQLSIPAADKIFAEVKTTVDKNKRIELANQADKLLWTDVHTLPLYQRPQFIAVKSKLANFGAFGLASPKWQDIGYTK